MKKSELKNIIREEIENFTKEEHKSNLTRLNINKYEDLVGQEVYYSQPGYGIHTVIKWSPSKEEYLLDLDGQKFWSNPFIIKRKNV